MKFLIYPAVEQERLEKIVQAAGQMAAVNAANEAEALREIAEADAFFGKITPDLLAASGQLRWIQSPTASLEHYVFDALVEHPAVLTNMRGLYSDIIADQVLGYIICFARNLHIYIRNQVERRWAPQGGEAGRPHFTVAQGRATPLDRAHQQLAGATLGIIGLGSIGSEIARRGLACGMEVIAVDPRQDSPPPGVKAVWPLERLDELLSNSDYVVIAAPHTPDTEKLFRRRQFQAMKPAARLINIGRGAIVVLDDLAAALAAGEIAGAALDVFETEPLPAEHPLWGMENVIITPHVAGFGPPVAGRHLETLLENIRRFAAGQELLNIADKAKWF